MLYRLAGRLNALFFAVILMGCAGGANQKDNLSSELDPIKTIPQRLSAVRGLKFTADVPIFFKQREAVGTDLKAVSEQERLQAQKQENVSVAYAKLGLLPHSSNWKNGLRQYYSGQSLGVYDLIGKKI